MHVLQSEKEGISAFVLAQLARRQVVLKEKARQIVIAKAQKVYRETHGDLPAVITILEWELTLIPALKRASDRILDVSTEQRLPYRENIEAYLGLQGLCLSHDSAGFYVVMPRSYDSAAVRSRIKKIIKGNK